MPPLVRGIRQYQVSEGVFSVSIVYTYNVQFLSVHVRSSSTWCIPGTCRHVERLFFSIGEPGCCVVLTDKCTKATILQFCFAAPPVTRFWGQTSAVLLPQLRNFSPAQEEILLLCYHKSRMFLIRQKFCCSVTTIAECFSPDQYSAVLIPRGQNVY